MMSYRNDPSNVLETPGSSQNLPRFLEPHPVLKTPVCPQNRGEFSGFFYPSTLGGYPPLANAVYYP